MGIDRHMRAAGLRPEFSVGEEWQRETIEASIEVALNGLARSLKDADPKAIAEYFAGPDAGLDTDDLFMLREVLDRTTGLMLTAREETNTSEGRAASAAEVSEVALNEPTVQFASEDETSNLVDIAPDVQDNSLGDSSVEMDQIVFDPRQVERFVNSVKSKLEEDVLADKVSEDELLGLLTALMSAREAGGNSLDNRGRVQLSRVVGILQSPRGITQSLAEAQGASSGALIQSKLTAINYIADYLNALYETPEEATHMPVVAPTDTVGQEVVEAALEDETASASAIEVEIDSVDDRGVFELRPDSHVALGKKLAELLKLDEDKVVYAIAALAPRALKEAEWQEARTILLDLQKIVAKENVAGQSTMDIFAQSGVSKSSIARVRQSLGIFQQGDRRVLRDVVSIGQQVEKQGRADRERIAGDYYSGMFFLLNMLSRGQEDDLAEQSQPAVVKQVVIDSGGKARIV